MIVYYSWKWKLLETKVTSWSFWRNTVISRPVQFVPDLLCWFLTRSVGFWPAQSVPGMISWFRTCSVGFRPAQLAPDLLSLSSSWSVGSWPAQLVSDLLNWFPTCSVGPDANANKALLLDWIRHSWCFGIYCTWPNIQNYVITYWIQHCIMRRKFLYVTAGVLAFIVHDQTFRIM